MCGNSMTRVRGGDRLLDTFDEQPGRFERDRERDPLDDDPLAAGALVPGVEHPSVVLVGDDDLVAALQVEAQDQGLHPLGGVAGDRQLLGVAAELLGQCPADGLDPRLEHLPHVVGRQLVAEPQVADHLLEHVRRCRADAAVIEVDERPIGVEAALDLRPVIFVAGQVAGRFALPRRDRRRMTARWRRGGTGAGRSPRSGRRGNLRRDEFLGRPAALRRWTSEDSPSRFAPWRSHQHIGRDIGRERGFVATARRPAFRADGVGPESSSVTP